MGVSIKDFQPINSWKIDSDGEKFEGGCCGCSPESMNIPMHIIDLTTGRKYLNQPQGLIRFKCFLLTLGTPIVHSIAATINVAIRILKLVTLSHFWTQIDKESKYNFRARLADAGKDLITIIATPLSISGLELAAFYGMFRPHDGRKLYASIERLFYGDSVLAPCFQPNATYHAFGGDIQQRNAF